MRPGSSIEVRLEEGDRRPFVPLLLEGDEDEAMLARYLDEGSLLAAYVDGELSGVALVVGQELMNIAVSKERRRKGLGSLLLAAAEDLVSKDWDAIIVGTGDHSPARAFFEANGFEEYGRRPGFFDMADGQASSTDMPALWWRAGISCMTWSCTARASVLQDGEILALLLDEDAGVAVALAAADQEASCGHFLGDERERVAPVTALEAEAAALLLVHTA